MSRAVSQAVWFLDNKIKVFPIKSPDAAAGIKGKEPDCRSWDDYVCGRSVAAKFQNYGVVLGLLGVIDSDDEATEEWVSKNVPSTPFIVNTARGKHRYYRLITNPPHFIHRNNFTIELRHRGQYVVGPGSVHASGSTYEAFPWSWSITDIPIFPVKDFNFDDRSPHERGTSVEGAPFVLPPAIKAGERHDMMFKLMRSLQARGVELPALLTAIQAENLLKCHPPIDPKELDTYIRRVSKHPDRKGFVKFEVIDLTLALGLTEAGLDPTTVLSTTGVDLLQPTDLTLDQIDAIIPGMASFDVPPDDIDFVPSEAITVVRQSLQEDRQSLQEDHLPDQTSPKPRRKKLTLEKQLAKAEERLAFLKAQDDPDLEIIEDNSEDELEIVEVDEDTFDDL